MDSRSVNICKTKVLSLDEAIAHCKECVDGTPCGENHRQLGEWLGELKELRRGGANAKMHETLMSTPKIEYRAEDDHEYTAIKCAVGYREFIEWLGDRSLCAIRLPLNNPQAYQYLRWLNEFYWKENNFLNHILNTWDTGLDSGVPIRPPTARELACVQGCHIHKLTSSSDAEYQHGGIFIDAAAELIRDAYCYWSCPDWMRSGLAGCVMKFGTFEDNVKDGDKFITYEEHENKG